MSHATRRAAPCTAPAHVLTPKSHIDLDIGICNLQSVNILLQVIKIEIPVFGFGDVGLEIYYH